MKLIKRESELFIPFEIEEEIALSQTTDLCIAAHQDDIEVMAYGAIAECYGRSDKFFTGVVCTDGANSPRTGIYADMTNEDMVAVRKNEQRLAASVGGYSAQFMLGYTSAQVKDADYGELVDQLEEIIKATRPQTIYTHNLADKHETHVAVALRTIAAIRRIPQQYRPEKLYATEVWRGLDWLMDNDKVVFDTSPHPHLSAALVGLFHSQIAGGKRYDLAIAGRRIANATFFESHSTDRYDSVSYGLDMTPLIENDAMQPAEFILRYIHALQNDVCSKIEKFSKS